jgi:hypothetical protein
MALSFVYCTRLLAIFSGDVQRFRYRHAKLLPIVKPKLCERGVYEV